MRALIIILLIVAIISITIDLVFNVMATIKNRKKDKDSDSHIQETVQDLESDRFRNGLIIGDLQTRIRRIEEGLKIKMRPKETRCQQSEIEEYKSLSSNLDARIKRIEEYIGL